MCNRKTRYPLRTLASREIACDESTFRVCSIFIIIAVMEHIQVIRAVRWRVWSNFVFLSVLMYLVTNKCIAKFELIIIATHMEVSPENEHWYSSLVGSRHELTSAGTFPSMESTRKSDETAVCKREQCTEIFRPRRRTNADVTRVRRMEFVGLL